MCVQDEVRYLKAWILFFLIATLGGFVAGFVAGAIVGFALAAAGIAQDEITIVAGVLGMLLALPIAYYSFKWSVRRYILAQVQPMS